MRDGRHSSSMTTATVSRTATSCGQVTVNGMIHSAAPLATLLPSDEIALLQRHADWRRVPAGTTLTSLRTTGRSLILVLEGSVTVKRPTVEPIALDASEGPIVIGELTLLSVRLSRTATVTTSADCVIVELPARVFDKHRAQLPALTALVEENARSRMLAIEASRLESAKQAYEQYRAYLDALDRIS
jgi:CRP-like cAMP-binding protein